MLFARLGFGADFGPQYRPIVWGAQLDWQFYVTEKLVLELLSGEAKLGLDLTSEVDVVRKSERICSIGFN